MDRFVIFLETIILAVSVVGNILVVLTMIKDSNLKASSVSKIMIAIAVVDFLSSVVAVPFSIHVISTFHQNYVYGTTCSVVTSIIMMLFTILINLLLALSADRYWAICHPLSYFKSDKSVIQKWVILFCCLIGICGGIPPMFGYGLNKDNLNEPSCNIKDIYVFEYVILTCVYTLSATSMVIVFYSLIYKAISVRKTCWLNISSTLLLRVSLVSEEKTKHANGWTI